jgi:hypothetical protein
MSRYRKKPVEIDAFRWTGGPDQTEDPEWICDALRSGDVRFADPGTPECTMLIETLEGTMTARMGDWIIRGTQGEIYPCKPKIFEQIYEAVP